MSGLPVFRHKVDNNQVVKKEGEKHSVERHFGPFVCCELGFCYYLCSGNNSCPCCSTPDVRDRYYFQVQDTRIEWNTPLQCCCCFTLIQRFKDLVGVVHYDDPLMDCMIPCNCGCYKCVCLCDLLGGCCPIRWGCIPHIDDPAAFVENAKGMRDRFRSQNMA